MKSVARFFASFEPFLLIGAVIFFWFASNFPAPAQGASGIITDEWLWIVTGLLPFYIAYWVTKTHFWRELPQFAKWMLAIGTIVGYIGIYLNLPFIPTPSYAIDRADWFWLVGLLMIWAVSYTHLTLPTNREV